MRRTRYAISGAVAALACVAVLGCSSSGGGTPAEQGRSIALRSGCTSCHGADGGGGVGPTWKGLAGSTVRLQGGGTVTADDAYLREAIRKPDAKVVRGYNPIMPTVKLSDREVDDLVAYIRSLATGSG
jgi:cytochrome c oxidase subunit 2